MKHKRLFSLLLMSISFSLCLAACGNNGHNVDPHGDKYELKEYAVKDNISSIKLLGRTILHEDQIYMDWTASGFSFNFRGLDDVDIKFTSQYGGEPQEIRLSIVVDNVTKELIINQAGETQQKIATNLEEGDHNVTIQRISMVETGGLGNMLAVDSLIFTGRFLDRPVDNEPYVAFVGDSITCGYGLIDPSSAKEDGLATYAIDYVKNIKADYSICSISGIGVYRSTQKHGYTENNMSKYFPYYNPYRSKELLYEPTRKADFVVVNLNGNDALSSNQPSTADQIPYKEALRTLITEIKTVFGSDAPIVWITGMMLEAKNPNTWMKSVFTELGSEAGGYYILPVPRDNSGGNSHPGRDSHLQVSAILNNFVKNNINSELGNYGEKVKYAIENNIQITLSSANVVSPNHVISVNEPVNVGELNNGEITSTSKSYSKYSVSKGMTSDGEYIYAILNAKTGSTKNSGFDVGVIAKIDTNGTVVNHTKHAFHWGNNTRLSYYDGKLYVSRTSNPSSSNYGAGTDFTSCVIEFDAKTLAYSKKTASADFSISPFNIINDGVFDMMSVNKDNTQCAIIYKNQDSYTLYTYQKNDLGTFEVVTNGVNLPIASDGATTSNVCSGVHISKDYVYTMWSIAKGGIIRVSDFEGNTILDKTIDTAQEGTHTKKNYQGIVEIDNKLYYSICDWSDNDNSGLMLFKVGVLLYSSEATALVSFDTNGANIDIPNQIVKIGEKVNRPASPTYSYTDKRGKTYNYVFENWYLGEEVWDFENNLVQENITLKANYTYPDEFFEVDENASERTNNTKARIMSFNVLSKDWNNQPPVDNTRANQAFDTIERYQPDVVGLQEFDNDWYTKASTLLDGYKIVNASSNKISGVVNYSTIAYNTETVKLLEYSQTRLTTCDNKKCRNVTVAAFEFIKGNNIGERFVVSCTHWNLQEPDRITQATETKTLINNFHAKYPNVPVFATGDYNSYDENESFNKFLEVSGYSDSKTVALDADVVCTTGHLGTPMREGDRDYNNPNHCFRGPASFGFKNVQSDSSIDHICVAPGTQVLFYNTIHDYVALSCSDHCPIFVDLSF